MAIVTAAKHESTQKQIEDLALLRPLTADDLRFVPDDGNRYEIIGGQLSVSPSPSSLHQVVLTHLAAWLYLHVIQNNLGRVIVAPTDVHLSANDVVQPNLLVILNQNSHIIREHGVVGAPDLVVEILSPSTMTADYIRKSALYALHGVKEYWIVDLMNRSVEVRFLQEGRFVLGRSLAQDDILRSPLLARFGLDLNQCLRNSMYLGGRQNNLRTMRS